MPTNNSEDLLILVVDDFKKNLQLIVDVLDNEGYSTTFATSGKQAIERIKSAQPDLILLDLMMPEMDGLEVCKILKDDPETSDIPVIFLTASDETDNLLQAFEVGAADYITKPFNILELLARVKTHLELKQARDQLRKTVEELQKTQAELEKIATTDPLTGIFNRRHLLMIGENEFQRANRYQRPFSILMLDIDRFKSINDNYGHDIGDEALKILSTTVLGCLRKVDCFGRFGGEEFVAILPETKARDAESLANRIRSAIAQISIPILNSTVRMTVSIGVATYRLEDETLNFVLKRADTALYQAKHQGRDRVIVHAEDLAIAHHQG